VAGPTAFVDGIAGLAGRYDHFILDLWGTLYDGYAPFPGAVEALEDLKRRGKRLLVLSNAPRRAAAVARRIAEIGIGPGHYDAVLSSGEAGRAALIARDDAVHRALGRRCYLLGPPKDDSVLEGVDVERVGSVAEASFILNVGTVRRTDTVTDYAGLLAAARARDLPMLCVNPDHDVLRGETREICAGAIAAAYEAAGGRVHYHGKPHRPIYETSLALLGARDRSRVLAVGDSLLTDIAGAAAAGIDSLFIAGGILAERLGVSGGGPADPGRLAALAAEFGAVPTYAAPAFRL
jgi:HAD superfamily hydrolase (TIGR01459 family)